MNTLDVTGTISGGARTRADASHLVVEGKDAVQALLPQLQRLPATGGADTTAGTAWLGATLRTTGAHAWAVVLHDTAGDPSAAAVLLDDDSTSHLAAGGWGHRAGVLAAGPAAHRDLGAALARTATTRAPWRRLSLGPLVDGDDARALASGAGARAMTLAPVPFVAARHDSDHSALLSSGVRRGLRKATNRLVSDGRTWQVRTTRDLDEVGAAIPNLANAYRSRDLEHGLTCPLDDPAGRALWQARVEDLVGSGLAELVVLTIDGSLAAYVLGAISGHRYGVLEGHFHTHWSRYSPGRLLEAEVLHRALADPRVDGLDWMTSVAPETLLAADGAEPLVHLEVPVGP